VGAKNGVVIRTSCLLSNGDLSNQNDQIEILCVGDVLLEAIGCHYGFLFFLGAGHLGSATGTTAWRILKRTGNTSSVATGTRRDLTYQAPKAKLVL
jgi:hypothetical protein